MGYHMQYLTPKIDGHREKENTLNESYKGQRPIHTHHRELAKASAPPHCPIHSLMIIITETIISPSISSCGAVAADLVAPHPFLIDPGITRTWEATVWVRTDVLTRLYSTHILPNDDAAKVFQAAILYHEDDAHLVQSKLQ